MTPPLDERIERERLAREAREREAREKQYRREAAQKQEEWDAAHRAQTPPPPAPRGRDSHVEIESPKGSIRIHAGNITIKDIVYMVGAATLAVTWYQNLANKKYVDDAAANAVATSASAAVSAVAAALPPVIREMRVRDAKQDKRWDRMDDTAAAVKRKPGTMPPPKFGPKAERLGEVKYENPSAEEEP